MANPRTAGKGGKAIIADKKVQLRESDDIGHQTEQGTNSRLNLHDGNVLWREKAQDSGGIIRGYTCTCTKGDVHVHVPVVPAGA